MSTFVLLNQDQVSTLVGQIGTDIATVNNKIGSLTKLNTTAKTSVVDAINEVLATSGNAPSGDYVTTTQLNTAVTQAKSDILGGAPDALNTLNEIATAINDDTNLAGTLTAAISNRVRFDAPQTLTADQQTQAQSNIGLTNQNTDFVNAYTLARGALV